MKRGGKLVCLITAVALIVGTNIGNGRKLALASSGPAEGCGKMAGEWFGARLVDAYSNDWNYWNTSAPTTPATVRPGYPQPAESEPPFPYSNWPIGATSDVAYSQPGASYATPLMDAIYCGSHGKWWKDSNIQIFGWLEPGVNASTSNSQYRIAPGDSPHGASASLVGTGGNNPIAYDVYPNTIQLDQLTLYVQKSPDEVQTDHFDWGFRLTNLFGSDYKYTFSHDILSQQYIRAHNKYGYDPVMGYVDLYFPQIAAGMNVRMGRYISIPDIEAQLAPDNLTFSHSDVYTVDPYTQTGIVFTIRWNKNWQTQMEFSGGNDVAPWDWREVQPTGAFCVAWTSDSGRDNIYPCMNTFNDGRYRYNNMQHPVVTWYHAFDPNGPLKNWHTDTETYFMWERETPNLNNPLSSNLLVNNGNGAYCGRESEITCTSSEYGIVNYIMYQYRPNAYLTFRNEYYNDFSGQRTGYKTQYSEHFIGTTWFFGEAVTVRPGLRYDRSYNVPVYDNGKKWGQFTFEMDTIFHY